jgi:hypothetical protein
VACLLGHHAGLTRCLSSCSETVAQAALLPIFPYLTLAQAVRALAQNGGLRLSGSRVQLICGAMLYQATILSAR